jgi:hypothetical protein
MTADPYCTVEDWLDQLDLDGHADTCADEAYGDQWGRMDAYLAEREPWPASPIAWDITPKHAQVMAEVGLYGGRYHGQWGVFLIGGSAGPQAERIMRRAAEDRLLDAIFGGER